MMRTALIISA